MGLSFINVLAVSLLSGVTSMEKPIQKNLSMENEREVCFGNEI